MRFHLLFGSGALIVLGAAYLLGHEGTTPGVPVDTQGQRAEYGYVALDADVLQTSEQGTPLYTFSAARVEQKAGSGDIAASTSPRYTGMCGHRCRPISASPVTASTVVQKKACC